MVLQQVPTRGRVSIMKLQKLPVQKRKTFIRIIYGSLMVATSLVLFLVDPLRLITAWMFEVREGSYVYNMWEKPSYQLYAEVWIFNYTNAPQYLSGEDKVMKLQEIGPFLYQEFRTNRNITVDRERGVMRMTPHIALQFRRDMSIADVKDVHVYVPNMALLAMSTIIADNVGYVGNAGAYYTLKALGSTLFKDLTVEEMLWGYEDVTVTIASSLLPGWINFDKIGILDRFYAQKEERIDVEISDPKNKFSIVNWNGSPGIVEQGFTDLNTSNFCNRARGAFEGLTVPPHLPKDVVIQVYRRQACRIVPFVFQEEKSDKYSFNYYRFVLEQSAFNNSSPYACICNNKCLPDGFIDVSKCYYGFPITLSKPHFLDVDPVVRRDYEGLNPNNNQHLSAFEVEPTLGVPLSLSSKVQVNLAVRTSDANPITKPFHNKMVPLVWISLYCKEPPPDVLNLLIIRLVIAPPLIIAIEVLLFIIGLIIGVNGCYRCLRPKYIIVDNSEAKKVCENTDLVENDDARKDQISANETAPLWSIREDNLTINLEKQV